jgi:hypothetical protein
MNAQTGKYLIVAGTAVIVLGILIYFFHDKFSWVGRLPGDIRIEGENSRFYFPISTMILFSLGLTIIVNLIRRLL